jgi:glycosyltransferase involved in cell wall biosynthesis
MKTTCKNETVSVIIPAYNSPEYTRISLASIAAQHYRPIEIVLSDDHSPVSLEPVAKEFAESIDDRLTLKFFRQSSNLGVIDNFSFSLGQAAGKFVIPFAHDNRFIDAQFISEAVELMKENSECLICVANAVYENSKDRMLNLPTGSNQSARWRILPGDAFIRLWRKGGMGWSQAIVLDRHAADAVNAFDEPYLVNASLARRLNIAADNAYSYVFLLSAIGSVALSNKVVCEIGTPRTSYSRSDKKWKNTRSKVKFVVFYNIYKSPIEGKHAQTVREMAKKQAFEYIDKIFSIHIARYYNYSFEILQLMALSILMKMLKKAKKRFNKVRQKG